MPRTGQPRGRSKVDWYEFYHEEVLRRLASGEAFPTVTAEGRNLAEWAKARDIKAKGHKRFDPITAKRMTARLTKRMGGAIGYKLSRQWFRDMGGFD